jgi:sialic acid synthase SpsE
VTILTDFSMYIVKVAFDSMIVLAILSGIFFRRSFHTKENIEQGQFYLLKNIETTRAGQGKVLQAISPTRLVRRALTRSKTWDEKLPQTVGY